MADELVGLVKDSLDKAVAILTERLKNAKTLREVSLVRRDVLALIAQTEEFREKGEDKKVRSEAVKKLLIDLGEVRGGKDSDKS